MMADARISKRIPRLCYQCGAALTRHSATKEHVPPECIFPKPRLGSLLQVPACRECNGGHQKDDEYFRNWIMTRAQDHHPAARQLFESKTMRSFQRSPGLRSNLLRKLRPIALHSPDGIHLGPAYVAFFDDERIERTLRKIVRGVYMWETETLLPPQTPIAVTPIFETNDTVQSLVDSCPRLGSIEHDVFIYKFGLAEDDPTVSMCFLFFYRSVLVLGLTGEDPDAGN